MGTLLMAAIVLCCGAAFTAFALYVVAGPGVEEAPPGKTVWVPVGNFFVDEAGEGSLASSPSARSHTLRLEEHVRREHAAAANFLTVLTPESLHAPINPSQMD
jgi:hypothetical protein